MFFPNHKFRDRVLEAAERIILKHGGKDGRMAMAAFIGIMEADVESGELNLTSMSERWRKAKLRPDEGALGLIDGIVNRLKRKRDEGLCEDDPKGFEVAINTVIEVLERALDTEFMANPGRLVPVNGRMGAGMTKNMSRFLKPL